VFCHHHTTDSAKTGHVVGYGFGEALLKGLQQNLPDLVLLDMQMSGLSDLEALTRIIHDGLWRNCAGALRDGHAESRGPEAY
jgi:CheY-like chemotaxis protein